MQMILLFWMVQISVYSCSLRSFVKKEDNLYPTLMNMEILHILPVHIYLYKYLYIFSLQMIITLFIKFLFWLACTFHIL